MKISFNGALALMTAFGCGFGLAHLPAPASAQTPVAAPPPAPAAVQSIPMTMQTIDVITIPVDKYKAIVVQPGGTVAVQEGPVPKHYHVDTDEVQLYVSGTGTEWLGNKQVDIKPGTLLVIPRLTAHGGQVVTSGPLRFVSIHLPPQMPGDAHPVP
jgi:mannose-6-phosphate isomerase-like protein (cupin superfamily)